jgi:deoxycytidine triphosphate deaminase
MSCGCVVGNGKGISLARFIFLRYQCFNPHTKHILLAVNKLLSNKVLESILSMKFTCMPTLLNNLELAKAIEETSIISNGKSENLDGIKYDFSLSSFILKARFKQPIDINQLPELRKGDITVEPGEVVFVLSNETLSMPVDIMALLIPKRKLSHDGIMILGGLSVDPLYEGKLLIGLYNLSSSPYPLIPGRKLIGAQFYRLAENEKSNLTKPKVNITSFPDELIRLMQNYKPVSTEALINLVDNLQIKFDQLLQEFKSKDDWFTKLQESMDRHEKNIDKILLGLEKEGVDRRASDTEIEKKIDKITDEVKVYARSSYKTAAIVGTLGALIISFLIWLIQFVITKNNEKPAPAPTSIVISMDSVSRAMRSGDSTLHK